MNAYLNGYLQKQAEGPEVTPAVKQMHDQWAANGYKGQLGHQLAMLFPSLVPWATSLAGEGVPRTKNWYDNVRGQMMGRPYMNPSDTHMSPLQEAVLSAKRYAEQPTLPSWMRDTHPEIGLKSITLNRSATPKLTIQAPTQEMVDADRPLTTYLKKLLADRQSALDTTKALVP